MSWSVLYTIGFVILALRLSALEANRMAHFHFAHDPVETHTLPLRRGVALRIGYKLHLVERGLPPRAGVEHLFGVAGRSSCA